MMNNGNNRKKASNAFARLGPYVRSIDSFGQSTGLEIDGSSTFNSIGGALITLVIFAITISYSVRQFMVMLEYGDTHHLTTTEAMMNSQRLLTSTESNFNFALAFFNFRDNELVDARNLVEVEVSQMIWG